MGLGVGGSSYWRLSMALGVFKLNCLLKVGTLLENRGLLWTECSCPPQNLYVEI